MDLIAMRFEARHLEVEGKLQEALDICRDILHHFAHEPPNEQLLPVFVQASELSIKLGDREGGATLLLVAAERYADAGLARAVIDLYQRLRRLGPARKGLDLQFARRMLAHRHAGAAREFLAELARRQKKERLSATLERMAAWSDDKVQHQLLEFLDRAEGIRGSAATPRPSAATPPPTASTPPVSEEVTQVPPPAPAPAPVPESPAREPPAPEPPAPPPPVNARPPVMPADAVVFVTPARPRQDHRATRPALVPPRRRRGRSRVKLAVIVGVTVVVLAAGAVFLVPQLRRAVSTLGIPGLSSPTEAAVTVPVRPIPADPALGLGDSAELAAAASDSGRPAVDDSAVVIAPLQSDVAAAPPDTAPSPALTPRVAPAPRDQPVRVDRPPVDTARPPVAAPPPVAEPAPEPSPSRSLFGVDYAVVIVEGLEVVGITREGEGSGRILVRQLLPSGDTLELRESDLGEASVGVGVGRVLVGRHPAGGSMGTVRVGRYLVSARAPVAPEVLEPWLQRLVERGPG
jgi:hypothetical protein